VKEPTVIDAELAVASVQDTGSKRDVTGGSGSHLRLAFVIQTPLGSPGFMSSTALAFLAFLALVAGLLWLWLTPSSTGWQLGAVELGNAAWVGAAAVAVEARPGSALSRRLTAFAQLSMLLSVVIPSAISPDLRLVAAAGVPAVVVAAVILVKPQVLDRRRWPSAFVSICAMGAGILVIVGALLVAAIVFGTRG
jgi:hypothetical protein